MNQRNEGLMNIGLLVTELEDAQVKDICIGAAQAARDKDVKLIIIPGKYIDDDKNDYGSPYSYQNAALFDYCVSSGMDAVIIDVDRIGSKSTILKREALLDKFEGIPVITLSKHEDYLSVNIPEAGQMSASHLGYEAVCDAAIYVRDGKLPDTQKIREVSKQEVSEKEAMLFLRCVSELVFERTHKADGCFESILGAVKERGINDFGILLYDKKVRNTVKYPWILPDTISSKKIMVDGKDYFSDTDSKIFDTKEIFRIFEKSSENVFILGDLYVDEFQLGIMFSSFAPLMLTGNFFDSFTGIITGLSRIFILEKELARTSKELYEVQEELARDDSVLDHIGDQDYLTGGLNRRGFFAKAYDLLKEQFKAGKYAIVAYIYMESLKRINEIFGHEEGDRAVKMVAEILDEVFGNCVYGRIRGNEFAVITIADEDGTVESLREEMANQNNRLLARSGRYINRLQYSICEFSYEEDFSLREMLKETDENLQRLKGNG